MSNKQLQYQYQYCYHEIVSSGVGVNDISKSTSWNDLIVDKVFLYRPLYELS